MARSLSTKTLSHSLFLKRGWLRAALVVLVGLLADLPARAQWTPEEMMKVRSVGMVEVSPDGKRVVYGMTEPLMTEDKSEFLTQLWMADADGTRNFQFTRGDKSSYSPRWSPDGRWVAFLSSRSGKSNIWVIRADGGEAEMVTDVKTGVGGFAWSPDGASLAFTMSDPPSEQEEKDRKARNDARVVDADYKMNHLWVVPAAVDAGGKREVRRLTEGGFTVGNWEWSPDGKTIVFDHAPTPSADDWPRSDISTVDVASGAIKPFAASAAAESSPFYSPDGRWVAYRLSDVPATWGDTRHVVLVPAAGGPVKPLALTYDEQPDVLGWSADGKGLYFTETHGTITRLGYLPSDGGAPRLVDSGTAGVFGASVNSTRTMLGLSVQSCDTPPEAFVTPAAEWAPRQVSRANADSPKHPLGRTEVIRWKGADGLEIEGLLTYPVGYEKGKRYPMVLVIHGGPTGVFMQSYIASRSVYPTAAFAAQGWAVLRCNIRGSSGYGRAFRYADYKDWGGKDYRDLMAGVDHVIAMGVAEADRLGVMGWSYGGYMSSWVITQTKRFKAASIGAPVTNLMSFTGTTDIHGFVPDYFGTEFWNNLAPYEKHSAMFNIKGASTPTMIQQGEEDRRVPIGQGYELYNALKRQGVKVTMIAYPRQPHGLGEPRLILDAGRRNLKWFEEYLGEKE
jgi:dipeptidyl aminopeptidase/acylaminoacyl peptidase